MSKDSTGINLKKGLDANAAYMRKYKRSYSQSEMSAEKEIDSVTSQHVLDNISLKKVGVLTTI